MQEKYEQCNVTFNSNTNADTENLLCSNVVVCCMESSGSTRCRVRRMKGTTMKGTTMTLNQNRTTRSSWRPKKKCETLQGLDRQTAMMDHEQKCEAKRNDRMSKAADLVLSAMTTRRNPRWEMLKTMVLADFDVLLTFLQIELSGIDQCQEADLASENPNDNRPVASFANKAAFVWHHKIMMRNWESTQGKPPSFGTTRHHNDADEQAFLERIWDDFGTPGDVVDDEDVRQ